MKPNERHSKLAPREMAWITLAAALGICSFALYVATSKLELQRQVLSSENSKLRSEVAVLEKAKVDLTRRLIIARGLPGYGKDPGASDDDASSKEQGTGEK